MTVKPIYNQGHAVFRNVSHSKRIFVLFFSIKISLKFLLALSIVRSPEEGRGRGIF